MKATLSGYFFMLVVYTTQAHDISKRATTDKLYVLGERDGGCVSVESIEPCNVTWKLSALAAKFYNQQTRQISVALKGLELLMASDECKNAYKTTMCGQAAPKCLADGSQDYGNVNTTCAKIYSECPKNVSVLFKSQMLCDKVYSGKQAKPTCVAPPKIEGSCPQPKYKMPTDAINMYKRSSSNNDTVESLKQVGASPNCTSNVEKVQCVTVYCSEDEKYLLTEFNRAYCENITKSCLVDPIEELIKTVPFLEQHLRPTIENLEETCAVYPNRSITTSTTTTTSTTSTTTNTSTTSTTTTTNTSITTSQAPPPVGPTGSGNIQLVDCVALLFSFFVVKLFA